MVDMYYRLVNARLRTIQKVPDQFRAAVMEALTALALEDWNGYENKTSTKKISAK